MSPRPRKRSQPPSERTKLKNVALFKDSDEPTKQSASPQTLRIEQIVTSPSQPRRYFDPDKLEQLTQSVKEHGILEPLLVRPLADERYELVAGERRYQAAEAAGLTSVPVVVKELTDTEALQLALVENLQREDLNPVEETEGILQLLSLHLDSTELESRQLLYQMKNAVEKKKDQDDQPPAQKSSARDNVIPNSDDEAEQTVQSVFAVLGHNWYSFTCNRLPLLNLPEDILEALRSGKIEYTKAKAIARVKDEAARKQLLEEAHANSLSLSQIRSLVKAEQAPKQQSELRTRFDATYKQAKKAQKLWSDAKKRKQLESLLAKLEKLIESEK